MTESLNLADFELKSPQLVPEPADLCPWRDRDLDLAEIVLFKAILVEGIKLSLTTYSNEKILELGCF